MTNDNKEMSFFDHLEELRKCIFKVIIAVFLGFIASWAFSKQIFEILLYPFNDVYRLVINDEPSLIFTSLFEPFMAYLKVSLVTGIFVSSPFILYETWRFVAPALFKKERKLIISFVILGALFFIGGALFGYFVIFPIGFKFFMSFSTEVIQPAIKVSDYLKVSLGLLLLFGGLFELPLFVLLLVYLNIINYTDLLSKWRYILIGIAVLSAVLTPADPVSMILTMIPLFILYGLTTIAAFFIFKFKKLEK